VKVGKGPLALRVGLSGGSGFDITEAGTEKRLALHVVNDPMEVERVASLGPDPLDPAFDAAALAALLAGRRAQLKGLLTDQSVLAGVGNAYSDEALHAARLSPFKPAGSLTAEENERLYTALIGVLRDAVERSAGLPAKGLKSEKRSGMAVHGRTGEACGVCGDTVREVSFATKSFQYCPTCQTGGKPLADRRLSRLLK
jgi:formamidopyrimidine-DNA glycosylase